MTIDCLLNGCRTSPTNDGLEVCTNCGARFVLHQCVGEVGLGNVNNWRWLPVVLPLVSDACPECGVVVRLVQKAESTFELPPWATTALDGLATAALVVGAISFLRELDS